MELYLARECHATEVAVDETLFLGFSPLVPGNMIAICPPILYDDLLIGLPRVAFVRPTGYPDRDGSLAT